MEWIDVVGHVGSVLSSITFMPQVYQTWKTRSVGDLSMMMLLIVCSSTVVWLVYGIGRMLWPVIICNAVICFLSLLLIWFKIKFSTPKQP
ncbi:MAG: hypothetical protein IT254_02840 [Chitinophagaceae bacterium]|nr:hypothetical protein [Bacteroidota bacterium]MCC6257235.1 hypothetical protein [Chitinophagaceae bacterium]MCW5916125.1 hypothetical protein [Ferruginibacter sp.]